MSRWLFAVLIAIAPQVAGARSKKKVDEIALARVLLGDGHASRAATVLAGIDPKKDKVDLGEFYRLRGLAEHELGRYRDAVTSFEQAMREGETGTSTWYALANSLQSAERSKEALSALERAPREIWSMPGAWRVKARAYRHLGDRHRAFEAADLGLARFPVDLDLERLRALLFLELGLSREGIAAVHRLSARRKIDSEDYLSFAATLAAHRDLDGAALLLEASLLSNPDDADVRKQLAKTYFEAGRPLSAARVMHPLAIEDPSTALLAADLYRRAGKLEQALRMNALIPDQKEKVRQRLNLLIEAERYGEAAALHDRAERLGLLSDEKLVYAIAFAHYVAGDEERVEELLGRISEPELFAKAAAIRRSVDACERDVWQCE